MRASNVDSQTVGWLVLLALVLIWVHLPHADRIMMHDLLELAGKVRCETR